MQTSEVAAKTRRKKKHRPSLSATEQRELARRLAKALSDAGLTQKGLSGLIGVDDGQISRLTRGERVGGVTLATLVLWADACHVDRVDLVFGRRDEAIIRRSDLPDDWDEVLVHGTEAFTVRKKDSSGKPKRPNKSRRDAD